MRMKPCLIAACAALMLAMSPVTAPLAYADAQGAAAFVNAKPITERDITQRIALLKVLGDANGDISRKAALRSMIDEQVKLAEITKFKLLPTDAEVRDYIARISKGMQTTPEGLAGRLKKQGIGETTFKRYVTALIGFNRILSSKYRGRFTVEPAEVDAKFAEIKNKADTQISKIMNDPRMKGVTVFSLMEINLPVEANDSMLLQSRAVEAQLVLKRLNGCGNARAAADGIFNVKVGKKFEADAAKLPKQLRAALEKAGNGRAVGPMRSKTGIQLLAFCGSRKVTPPKPKFEMPTRQQVERSLINEKFDGLEEEYMKTAREQVYVEYRNSSYAQQ